MRFCIDMDGVVTDFATRALKMAEKKLGIKIEYNDVTETKMADFIFAKMTDEQKTELEITQPSSLYRIICPRNFFRMLKPYKSARKAVTDLIEAGHQVVFVTKPLEWKYSSEEKENWLHHNIIIKNQMTYDPDPYSLFMVKKLEDKCLVQADFYIDDDPRVLREIEPEHAICVSQPWNQEYIKNEFKGRVVKSMKEVASLVKSNKIQ